MGIDADALCLSTPARVAQSYAFAGASQTTAKPASCHMRVTTLGGPGVAESSYLGLWYSVDSMGRSEPRGQRHIWPSCQAQVWPQVGNLQANNGFKQSGYKGMFGSDFYEKLF